MRLTELLEEKGRSAVDFARYLANLEGENENKVVLDFLSTLEKLGGLLIKEGFTFSKGTLLFTKRDHTAQPAGGWIVVMPGEVDTWPDTWHIYLTLRYFGYAPDAPPPLQQMITSSMVYRPKDILDKGIQAVMQEIKDGAR